MEIKLNFVPPSVNMCYRHRQNRLYLSSQLRQYQKRMIESLKGKPKTLGLVQLNITFSFTNKRKRDLDNLLKPFIDSIKDILIEDDCMIYRITCEKLIDQEEEFTKLKISL